MVNLGVPSNSAVLAISPSTSQVAHSSLPLKEAASVLTAQTIKPDGNDTILAKLLALDRRNH